MRIGMRSESFHLDVRSRNDQRTNTVSSKRVGAKIAKNTFTTSPGSATKRRSSDRHGPVLGAEVGFCVGFTYPAVAARGKFPGGRFGSRELADPLGGRP